MSGLNGFNYGFNNGFGMYQVPQNVYQRQMPQYQQQFQSTENQPIKIVESENSVLNMDVPMDGNPYYFIKADGSEIYSKFWTKEMKTKINKYILCSDSETEENKPELDVVLKNYFETLDRNLSNRIDSINENILNLNKPVQRNNKTAKEA